MPFRLSHIILLFIALQSVGVAWGQEEGLASYYHERFHGRKSSSGRIHDKDELVAAHRTYPFGTYLRVTNLDNMNTVIVCVTDRGPHRRKRIIDVSSSAAEILGFKKKGIARVRIEEVPGPIDLRWLELIYPKPAPYLQPKEQPAAPYHMKIKP
ncbi:MULTISPECIES: septal ring lytic transglycosylase RlpA family protein [unclassified Parabacteroides]|jgi:rare lipoprotein A|uniref:septal ring lytic transglycosylase RlpA family protein n=1 Tax=unclassified Parabacteroides TaxID=2649774 RepID=UPI000F0055C7|nr:septal ring lytic transglycosylase RlpA family protein [Parabacteroides sp. TM07-1AC]RHU30508.1 septal ring lytic transglycosylase RlpA family protein [Parabacteroides sp. TM07-1AC]